MASQSHYTQNQPQTILQAPNSIHDGVVIRILCHNDRGRPQTSVSPRPGPRQAHQTQGQFLLRELTGDWGGRTRARAGLVLVAGEGWRTSQPEPGPGESGGGAGEALAPAPTW